MKIGDAAFGVLTTQATDDIRKFHRAYPDNFKAIFSPEHGFYSFAAAGEKVTSMIHPQTKLPIYSLYGDRRHPTKDMLNGLKHIVIDLFSLGVRCYTYLATIKNMLEACAENGIAVTVIDHAIPGHGLVDGPIAEKDMLSFVCPIEVPFCHGMTPGECAKWIVENEQLEIDLDVIMAVGEAGVNFVPPSPAIRSWDSAMMYPLTVFTEAYPAIDCNRSGSLAFRVLGAKWMDGEKFMDALEAPLHEFGIAVMPYHYDEFDGVLFSIENMGAFRPVSASAKILTYLFGQYREEMAVGSRPEWLDKLMGTVKFREAAEGIK